MKASEIIARLGLATGGAGGSADTAVAGGVTVAVYNGVTSIRAPSWLIEQVIAGTAPPIPDGGLRQVRESLGQSMYAVARASGVNAQTISNIERGASANAATLCALAQHYEVDLGQLVRWVASKE